MARGRPRDLDPSPGAMLKRAQRSGHDPKPPTLPDEERAVSEDAADALIQWPDVKADAPMEEAVRLRAVFDARKARLAAMAEGLRLDQDRGKLWTSAQVRARDERWNAAVADRLDLVERLLDHVNGVTPEQRAAFLSAAREWRLRTKATLADVHG